MQTSNANLQHIRFCPQKHTEERPTNCRAFNTQSTQEWVTRLLADRKLIRLWKAEPADHQDLCEQLLNDQETILRASRTWDRISYGKANDQRDNLRYGFVGAQLAKQLGTNREVSHPLPTAEPAAGFIRRPERTGGFIRRRS